MCYQICERYSVCHCLYHLHSIDHCGLYGQAGHRVEQRTVLVGYACPNHLARHRSSRAERRDSGGRYDEGYGSSYNSYGYSSGSGGGGSSGRR